MTHSTTIADHNMQPVEHAAVGIIGLMFVGVILKRRDITAVTIAADGAVGCNSTVGKLMPHESRAFAKAVDSPRSNSLRR